MDKRGITIRRAGARDLPQIRALLAKCDLPWEDITEPTRIAFLVATTSGGEVVGSAGLEPYGPVGLLRSLAVRASVRGMQIGRALVTAAEAEARQQAMEALYLLTTTAGPFFARAGYVIVDRSAVPQALQASSQFASICPASATCMYKTLRA
ncbi:arsenic resistance N-acetyltransferase ArsN2 [Pandoraea sp. XY-2]|uniref:arsenic resistance N-acetyltransferase ArsN2 n=1 Tax=Pandoraea sp. XY-2 TaxID=2518599 RepID=UPI00101AFB5A|nr:arsenic resistance N-acetyltransferase ArsN2 [Pandoraea sp. XY-2]QBC30318.1 GNAT family N-acetyltransferase [Pandoraea sp. XY-2]